jgi:hypothetical protein
MSIFMSPPTADEVNIKQTEPGSPCFKPNNYNPLKVFSSNQPMVSRPTT